MDFNNDGMLDIVVGERYGYIHYFRRTGPGINDLTAEGKITANGTIIDTGYNSAPVVVDWNNDGLLDIVVGDGYYGGSRKTRIYLNSGTTSSHVFTNYTFLQNSGSDMQVQSCMPDVYDLNGDGKKDFIAGMESGYLYYYENVGTDAAPVFSGYERLQSNGVDIKIRRATRVTISDWNNDGHPDLVVGEHDGYVTLFLAATTGTSESQEATPVDVFRVEPVENPVTDSFQIKLICSDGPVSIAIYDSMGRMAKSFTVSGQSDIAVLSAESMAVGVYTVVATHGGSMSSCRVVVTR
ncbi:MAG: T9SS type A sorting domain-containing protein [Candidatus Sabulitectum sp.]|nr:T9SS type A sorting domain-containing protein [Candidatus Sabulitectum sp.]